MRLSDTTIAVLAVIAASLLGARAAAKVECHAAGGFIVIGRERVDNAGTDFLVRRAVDDRKTACAYRPMPGDLRLEDPSHPYWYHDLRRDRLVLTESTGPTQNVVVYDLTSSRKVLDVVAADDMTVTDAGLDLWVRTGKATSATCKTLAEIRKNGLDAVIETKARFTFEDARLAKARQTRCVGAQ